MNRHEHLCVLSMLSQFALRCWPLLRQIGALAVLLQWCAHKYKKYRTEEQTDPENGSQLLCYFVCWRQPTLKIRRHTLHELRIFRAICSADVWGTCKYAHTSGKEMQFPYISHDDLQRAGLTVLCTSEACWLNIQFDFFLYARTSHPLCRHFVCGAHVEHSSSAPSVDVEACLRFSFRHCAYIVWGCFCWLAILCTYQNTVGCVSWKNNTIARHFGVFLNDIHDGVHIPGVWTRKACGLFSWTLAASSGKFRTMRWNHCAQTQRRSERTIW